jgi:F-box protein, helicase, 18
MRKRTNTGDAKTWTNEQLQIFSTTNDLAINAVAGSGKTTTIIEYAATRPADARILYLAFNKSVKLEAVRKFEEAGVRNVKVETAHSLAYRYIVPGSAYKIKAQGYKTHEIAELLELKGNGEKHAEYIIANHINKFITYFCNSDKRRVQDLNYADTVFDAKAKNFVRTFYSNIEYGTRLLLSKMDKAEIEITHDFYLKKFQLSNPRLDYDYILFDEGQDASAAMLDVFQKQDATRVIVGDIHQQIYSWRHAVNSLAGANCQSLHLSTSFRFPQDIADLAGWVLEWKQKFMEYIPVKITGSGSGKDAVSVATIARTNLGLLLKAIEFTTDNKAGDRIYFEGNIHSYTYADDGTSLYDVLDLYNGRINTIRDKLVRSMRSMDELEDYIKKTEDVQLGMMVEIVKEYANEIPAIMRKLKELHTGDADRTKARMIFSTVHRAKGMEYDTVHLVNDFVTEEKLDKLKAAHEQKKEPLNVEKWNEEINLLYVAITRARVKLFIPGTLVPKKFTSSPFIGLVQVADSEKDGRSYRSITISSRKPFAAELKEQRSRFPRSRDAARAGNQSWSAELDHELLELYELNVPVSEIADRMGRTRGAILARLRKLDAMDDDRDY